MASSYEVEVGVVAAPLVCRSVSEQSRSIVGASTRHSGCPPTMLARALKLSDALLGEAQGGSFGMPRLRVSACSFCRAALNPTCSIIDHPRAASAG